MDQQSDFKGWSEKHLNLFYALSFRISQDEPTAKAGLLAAVQQAVKELKAENRPVKEEEFLRSLTRHLISFLREAAKKGSPPKEAASFEKELNLRSNLPVKLRAQISMMIAGLRRLSFDDRSLLVLRDIGSLPLEMIAHGLRKPVQEVRRGLPQARIRLRDAVTAPFQPKRPSHGM